MKIPSRFNNTLLSSFLLLHLQSLPGRKYWFLHFFSKSIFFCATVLFCPSIKWKNSAVPGNNLQVFSWCWLSHTILLFTLLALTFLQWQFIQFKLSKKPHLLVKFSNNTRVYQKWPSLKNGICEYVIICEAIIIYHIFACNSSLLVHNKPVLSKKI